MKYIIIALLLSAQIYAQNSTDKSLLKAIEDLNKAMVDANKSQLKILTASNLSYGHSSGKIETKDEFIKAIVTGESDFVNIKLSNSFISITKKTGIVRHKFNADTNNNGKPGTVQLNVLAVWIKEKSGWKLLARQAIKV